MSGVLITILCLPFLFKNTYVWNTLHIFAIICFILIPSLLLLQTHNGTQASRFHKPKQGILWKKSQRNNLARTLQKEINNLSSKKRCSGVFLTWPQPRGQKVGNTHLSPSTETPLLQCYTEREILCIFHQHVWLIVVEILTNTYPDCCKYVNIFAWRGCDTYKENFLLGDNQEQKPPLVL